MINKLYFLKKFLFFGDGRDSRIWMNLDVNKLFIIAIFPMGVRNCGVHIRINLLISPIFFSILISVISIILSTLNVIPKDMNLFVQIKFCSWQKLALLSPHTPIFIILVFSILTYRPEISWNTCRAFRAALKFEWIPLFRITCSMGTSLNYTIEKGEKNEIGPWMAATSDGCQDDEKQCALRLVQKVWKR